MNKLMPTLFAMTIIIGIFLSSNVVSAESKTTTASVTVPGKPEWTEIVCPLQASPNGVHTLYVSMRSGNHIEIDWVRFNP